MSPTLLLFALGLHEPKPRKKRVRRARSPQVNNLPRVTPVPTLCVALRV